MTVAVFIFSFEIHDMNVRRKWSSCVKSFQFQTGYERPPSITKENQTTLAASLVFPFRHMQLKALVTVSMIFASDLKTLTANSWRWYPRPSLLQAPLPTLP